jgi:hypothetical protein
VCFHKGNWGPNFWAAFECTERVLRRILLRFGFLVDFGAQILDPGVAAVSREFAISSLALNLVTRGVLVHLN